MTSRRTLLQAAAGACTLAALPRTGLASNAIRLGNGVGFNDPQLAFITAGRHPTLNYYKAEDTDLEIVNINGAAQSLQALGAGNVDFSVISPTSYLPAVANFPGFEVISAYVWLRRLVYGIGVKPDSPIRRLEDLAGRRVGIRSQGDAAYPGVSQMLAELGVDPKKQVEWIAVGSTAPAGEALYRDRVDALAIWDAEFARIETAGFKMRYLENSPGSRQLFSGAFGIHRRMPAGKRSQMGGMLRALAKSTVFAHENPRAAILMHWDLYPETRPKGKSEEQALADAVHVINSRKGKWLPAEWQEDKRLGGSTRGDWQAQVDRLALGAKIPDPGVLFTNEFIPRANDFDRNAVVAQARAAKA